MVAATHLPLGLEGQGVEVGGGCRCPYPPPAWGGSIRNAERWGPISPMLPTPTPALRADPPDKGGSALALFLRDLRLGIRAGGGALTGVLFFLAVVATIPFARRTRPQPACAHRPGDPVDRRAARLAARARPPVPGRPRGRLARSADPRRRPSFAGADRAGEMPCPLDRERAAAGDRHAAARPVHECRAGRSGGAPR